MQYPVAPAGDGTFASIHISLVTFVHWLLTLSPKLKNHYQLFRNFDIKDELTFLGFFLHEKSDFLVLVDQ